MIITGVFETRKGNANDGKIVATFHDDIGSSVTPFTIGLGVVSPTGVVISNVLVNVAVLAIGGTQTLTIDIPLDSAGDYLSGNYALEFSYYNADSSESDVLEATYLYTPKHSPDHTTSSLVTMTTTVDCDAETLVAKDTTEYGDVTRLTRLITITQPAIADETPSTTTNAQLTETLTYTLVTYSSLLEVSFEYDAVEISEGFDLISRGSAALYAEDFIDCDPKICNLVKCLASKFNALKNKSERVGGWSGLSAQDQSNFAYASTLVNLAQMLRNCGKYAAAKPYVDEAADILNCDCGCTSTNTPTPL